jgi:hypothetical protein
MFNIQTVKVDTPIAARRWADAVRAAGGGFESNSLAIASRLAQVLQGRSYYPKIKYLLPMLGVGINAARVPLIDMLGVGAATNTNFVDADFSQSTGLQGNGTTKYLNSLILPSQLGTTNNGGLGYWELLFATGGLGPMGCANNASTNSYEIGLRDTSRLFRWGSTSNTASQASVPVNGHYYGQRSASNSRTLSLNGIQIGSNTTNDATSGANERAIYIVGANWPSPEIPSDNSRCGVAYMTDGTLTAADIVDLNGVLLNNLMIPTGKS